MTIEEVYEQNEKNHQEIIKQVETLEKKISQIPIKIKDSDKEPVMFNRTQFHQGTYDVLHFKGFGGKTFKVILGGFYLLQLIITFKLLFK